MQRTFKPSIVTASDLMQGDVIYQTPSGWSRSLHEAQVLYDPTQADTRLRDAQAQAGRIVGAYLAEIDLSTGTPEPAHFREAFRARGPSNYPHGKQEE